MKKTKKIQHSDALMNLYENYSLEPFIRHIRFPYLKNIDPQSKISFSYPITALVGRNGTNKSSVLRALYGSPNNYSLGNLWFSTEIDEIKLKEGGERPRFIYGYHDASTDKIVEVIKQRILKDSDPDYWEPTRPAIKDGMNSLSDDDKKSLNALATRWKAIDKQVVYIDFRATISAFDKFFYHAEFDNKSKKDFLRARSKHLKKIIDNNFKTYKPFARKNEKLHLNQLLDKAKIAEINKILGRDYKSIRLIEHELFQKTKAPTVILETTTLNYSEAFAGSGEFAVVMLVNKVLNAADRSLILLDEPEVSLHPGAQGELMIFLREQVKNKKLQVIISTHSSLIINDLPSFAIKLFSANILTGMIEIENNVRAEEAFYQIGDYQRIKKKLIIVEDKLAKEFIIKAIKNCGEATKESINIEYIPGGAEQILTKLIPPHVVKNETDVLFILDGDKYTGFEPQKSESIPDSENKNLDQIIKKITSVEIKPIKESNISPQRDVQLKRDIIDYLYKYLSYLPFDNPETYLIQNASGHFKEEIESFDIISVSEKDIIKKLTMNELDKSDVNSEDIFQTQRRMLAKIDINCSAFDEIRKMVNKFLECGTIR
nr:ATP-binding protein [uncultured Tolumonas sp.]